jgi:hypothetical protein
MSFALLSILIITDQQLDRGMATYIAATREAAHKTKMQPAQAEFSADLDVFAPGQRPRHH